MEKFEEYEEIAKKIRREVLEMIYRTKTPHIGCSFSITDILVALYFKILKINPQNPVDPNRDRFILSKGHGVSALYPVLAEKGFIPRGILDGFAKDGGTLEPHPTRNVSLGIEISSGSVGHGLSIGVGMALAAKYDRRPSRVFILTGDGELQEGSNWEAIMFASHHHLDNLTAIIDRNQCQILGRTSEVLDLEPLAEKWRSFGWEVKEVNGHSFEELVNAFQNIPLKERKPTCIIANTIKGKGVSFMENDLRWHDRYPDDEEYKKALAELS